MYFKKHHILRGREKGYSLLEVIVVTTLISILAVTALVNFRKIIATQRLKSASLYLSNYINKTRKDAIQNDYPCKIEINNATSTVSIVNIDGSTGPAVDGQCFNTTVRSINLTTLSDAPENLKICSALVPSTIDVSTQVVSDLLTFNSTDDCLFEEPVNTKNASPSSSLTITPSGLTTNSLIVKLKSSDVQNQRCILVLSPLGIIRNGVQTTNETCDFTNFN